MADEKAGTTYYIKNNRRAWQWYTKQQRMVIQPPVESKVAKTPDQIA